MVFRNTLLFLMTLVVSCYQENSSQTNANKTPGVGSLFKTTGLTLIDGLTPEFRVWYPTRDVKGKNARYVTRIPSFITGVDTIYGEAIEKAKADCRQPRPVIMFSHGDEGLKDQSWTTMEALAKLGYIVMSLDHIGNTQFNNPDTISLIPQFLRPSLLGDYRYNLKRSYTYFRRPNDLSRGFDWLLAHFESSVEIEGNGCFDRKSPSYITMGHSAGGLTAMMAGGASVDRNAAKQYCETNGSILNDKGKLVMCRVEDNFLGGNPDDPTSYEDVDANGDGIVEPRVLEGFKWEKNHQLASFYDGNRLQVKDPRVKAAVAVYPCCRETIEGGMDTLDVPTLIIGAENDVISPINREIIPLFQQLKPTNTESEVIVLKQGDHSSIAEMCDLLNDYSACNDFTRQGNQITIGSRIDRADEFEPNNRFVFHDEWCEAKANDPACLDPDLVEVNFEGTIEISAFSGTTQQVAIEVLDYDLTRLELQREIHRFLSPIVNIKLPEDFPERSENWIIPQ